MATEAGWRDVPILLHPHTEALAAFLTPGADEARDTGRNGTVPYHRHTVAGPSREQQQLQEERQEEGTPHPPKHGEATWVRPPALLSLREQTRQLQQQKRAKQKQHITMDATPSRYELPRELQQHGGQQRQAPNGEGVRSYTHTLVGVSPQQQATPTVSHRRERDGGVVVPVRMISSLMITEAPARPLQQNGGDGGSASGAAAARLEPTAGAAAAAAAGPMGGIPQPTPGASLPQGSSALEPSDVSQPHERRHAFPADGGRAHDAAGPAASAGAARGRDLELELVDLRCMDDDDALPPPPPVQARRQARAAPSLLGHSCHDLPLMSGSALTGGTSSGPGGAALGASRPLSTWLSAEHVFVGGSTGRGSRESRLPASGPPDTARQQQQQQAQQPMEQAQQLWRPDRQHQQGERQGVRLGAAAVAVDDDVDEEEGDGAMLIDVGSADRSAEGALMPTPERPRPAGGPAAGWDALRGFSFRGGEGGGGGGDGGQRDGVFGTLALLSTGAHDEVVGGSGFGGGGEGSHWQQEALMQQQHQQPTELFDVEIAEAEQGQPGLSDGGGGGGAAEARRHQRLAERRGGLGPQAATAAGAGSGAGAVQEDGFDADDEGEAEAREERLRGALRLSSLSSRWRPLPGLVSPPPWSPASPPPPSSAPAQQRLGFLASLSNLALSLPRDAPPTQTHQQQQQQPFPYRAPGPEPQPACPTAAFPQLHLGTGQADAEAVGAGRGQAATPGAGPGAAATDARQALEELLKLKCSLRRAVQGQNARTTGLILSLLAGLAVTPELLAESQVAALVTPLQSSSSAEVAGAARRLTAGWKDVLKAAARRPGGPLTPARGLSHATAAAAAAAAMADMGLDGGGRAGALTASRSAGAQPGPIQALHPHSARQPRPSFAVGSPGLVAACTEALPQHPHPHSHPQTQPHRQPRDVDVRDQAEPGAARLHPHTHSHPHRRASALQQRPDAAAHDLSLAALSLGLGLARSQSDVLPGAAVPAAEAEAVLAAVAGGAAGAVAAQPGRRLLSGVQKVRLQLAPLQPQPQPGARPLAQGPREAEVGAEGWGWRGMAAGSRLAPQPMRGRGGPRVPAGDGPVSGSHTVSGPEGGTDGDDTNGDGGGRGVQEGAAAGAGAVGASGTCGLRLGGGSGGKCCSDRSGAVSGPARSYSPVPTPTAAAGAAAAAAAAGVMGEGAGTTDRTLPHVQQCMRTPIGGGAAPGLVPAANPSPTPAEAILLPARDVSAGMALGLGAPSPGSVLTQPPPPCALSPPAALPLPTAVVGAAALLRPPPPPPGLLAPGSAGRKRKGERPSSRRRSSNPNKRPASGAILAGPRALDSGSLPLPLPLPLPPDVASGGAGSDDQRYPSPHGGPLSGVKTPARSSLLGLGLHAPLIKRQRHHAGGGGGGNGPSTHGGGGGGSATQVRRMSLMMSSLDLGTAAGGRGGEEDGEQASCEQTGAAAAGAATDGDADADMGSQDDEAAMMTSEDDLMPAAGPRSGGYGGGGGGMGSFPSWDDAGTALIATEEPSRGSPGRDRNGDAPSAGLGLGPGDDGGVVGGGSSGYVMHSLHGAPGVSAGPSAPLAAGCPVAGVGGSDGGGGDCGAAAAEPRPACPPASNDAVG